MNLLATSIAVLAVLVLAAPAAADCSGCTHCFDRDRSGCVALDDDECYSGGSAPSTDSHSVCVKCPSIGGTSGSGPHDWESLKIDCGYWNGFGDITVEQLDFNEGEIDIGGTWELNKPGSLTTVALGEDALVNIEGGELSTNGAAHRLEVEGRLRFRNTGGTMRYWGLLEVNGDGRVEVGQGDVTLDKMSVVLNDNAVFECDRDTSGRTLISHGGLPTYRFYMNDNSKLILHRCDLAGSNAYDGEYNSGTIQVDEVYLGAGEVTNKADVEPISQSSTGLVMESYALWSHEGGLITLPSRGHFLFRQFTMEDGSVMGPGELRSTSKIFISGGTIIARPGPGEGTPPEDRSTRIDCPLGVQIAGFRSGDIAFDLNDHWDEDTPVLQFTGGVVTIENPKYTLNISRVTRANDRIELMTFPSGSLVGSAEEFEVYMPIGSCIKITEDLSSTSLSLDIVTIDRTTATDEEKEGCLNKNRGPEGFASNLPLYLGGAAVVLGVAGLGLLYTRRASASAAANSGATSGALIKSDPPSEGSRLQAKKRTSGGGRRGSGNRRSKGSRGGSRGSRSKNL